MSIETALLTTLDAQMGTTGYVAAQDLRLALRALGYDKQAIAQVFSALVTQGLIERVKITDADGYFYLAYRQTSLQGH